MVVVEIEPMKIWHIGEGGKITREFGARLPEF
jgi:hypothetical protein